MDKEVKIMGCGYSSGICGYSNSNYQRARSFLTKEEKVEILKEYQKGLEKESQGVSEKIRVRSILEILILIFCNINIRLVF
jgi:hypothetical protein